MAIVILAVFVIAGCTGRNGANGQTVSINIGTCSGDTVIRMEQMEQPAMPDPLDPLEQTVSQGRRSQMGSNL